MSRPFLEFLRTELKHLEQAGLVRQERALPAEQLNLASGDYLGLSQHPKVKKAAEAAVKAFGVGLASSRIVTGTIDLHTELEKSLAGWLKVEQAVAFPSGYHANTGVFESLLSDRDWVFCDEMIRPSLADGIRLSRARVYAFRNRDLNHLEDRLKRSRAARFRLIATDGVFALDGQTADLVSIHALAEKYDAAVAVDDSHGLGVLGEAGAGTYAHLGLTGKIDLVTGSFGNALGGGGGGFAAGKSELIGWLRQKSRPHLSSTALAPSAAAAANEAIRVIREEPKLREELKDNVRTFREALKVAGLKTIESEHPAVAVLIGHAVAAQRAVDLLHRKGVYAMGFCHPVVPEGEARIRAQISARHTARALKAAAESFAAAARDAKVAAKA